MQPDSSWAGVLAPVVAHLFPKIPGWLINLILGTLVSVAYGIFRKRTEEPAPTKADTKAEILAAATVEPNPLHVVIPAAVTTVISGIPGIISAAAGEGIKRAGSALFHWLIARVTKPK